VYGKRDIPDTCQEILLDHSLDKNRHHLMEQVQVVSAYIDDMTLGAEIVPIPLIMTLIVIFVL
jgi:hypothetical protein